MSVFDTTGTMERMDANTAFVVHTKTKDVGNGEIRISCRKGLWVVYGKPKDAVKEARHYFIQYYEDGEYD